MFRLYMVENLNASDVFAYTVNSNEGGYVLNIANATAVLICSKETGQFEVELNQCPAICPNLPSLKFM